jgi:hypothetical protein
MTEEDKLRALLAKIGSQKTVSVSKLKELLVLLEAGASDQELEAYEKDLASYKEQRRANNFAALREARTKNHEGLLTLAAAALKSALVINGGAAAAVLAYLGAAKDQSGDLAASLLFFGIGVFAAVAGAGTGYLTQYAIVQKLRWGQFAHWVTVSVTLIALILFVIGIVAAWASLRQPTAAWA